MLDDGQAALAQYAVCLMRVVKLMRDVKAPSLTLKASLEFNPLNCDHGRGKQAWKARISE